MPAWRLSGCCTSGQPCGVVPCACSALSLNSVLPHCRVEALQALGFCWDAEEAEWRFMFERFQASQRQLATAAHSAALPAADDFLLTNWRAPFLPEFSCATFHEAVALAQQLSGHVAPACALVGGDNSDLASHEPALHACLGRLCRLRPFTCCRLKYLQVQRAAHCGPQRRAER